MSRRATTSWCGKVCSGHIACNSSIDLKIGEASCSFEFVVELENLCIKVFHQADELGTKFSGLLLGDVSFHSIDDVACGLTEHFIKTSSSVVKLDLHHSNQTELFHLVHCEFSHEVFDTIGTIDLFGCVVGRYASDFDIANVLYRLNDRKYKRPNIVSDCVESCSNRMDVRASSFPKASAFLYGLGLVSVGWTSSVHPFEEVRVV